MVPYSHPTCTWFTYTHRNFQLCNNVPKQSCVHVLPFDFLCCPFQFLLSTNVVHEAKPLFITLNGSSQVNESYVTVNTSNRSYGTFICCALCSHFDASMQYTLPTLYTTTNVCEADCSWIARHLKLCISELWVWINYC